MRVRLVGFAGLVIGMVAVPDLQALGQRVMVVATESQVSSPGKELLAIPVTVQFRNVSLREAVEAVAKEAGARLAYRSELLKAAERLVSIDVERMPLGLAIGQLLEGTGLHVVPFGQGVIAIRQQEIVSPFVNGIVAGKVIHAKTGQPIPGVIVTLDRKGNIVTGADGVFRISTEEGQHTITIRAVGFAKQSRQVTVVANETVELSFAMESNANVLDEVIVTGTIVATERRAITTPITVITAEDIKRKGITKIEQLFRGDVPNVIALEKGISVYDGGASGLGGNVQSKVYARGSSTMYGDASPLKTYVDGVEITDPSLLGTIDPESVERMEIISGPQAATIYGSGALGGVMQIFTKKGGHGDAPEITVSAKYGMLESSFSNSITPSHQDAINVTGGVPDFSYAVTGSHQYTGQWQPGLWSRSIGGSMGMSRTYDALMLQGSFSTTRASNGTFYCGDGSTGAMSGGGLILEKMRGTGESIDQGFPSCFTEKRESGTSSRTVSLNADYRLFQFWQHHLTVGQSFAEMDVKPRAPSFGRPPDSLFRAASSANKSGNLAYNTTILQRVGPLSSTLSVGIDQSWGRQTFLTGCLGDVDRTAITGCYTGGGAYATQSANQWSAGGFGNLRVGIFDRIFGEVAVRGERNPNYGTQHMIDWTPKYGLSTNWDIGSSTIKLLMSYGRSTRPPQYGHKSELIYSNPSAEPSEYIGRFANPDLRPEISKGMQYGIEVYTGSSVSFTLNRYEQHVSDLIQPIYVDSVLLKYPVWGIEQWVAQGKNFNVGVLRSHGWSGTGQVSAGPVTMSGQWSWDDSRVRYSAAFGPAVGQSFIQLPTHSAAINVAYAFRATSVHWSTSYIGGSLQDISGNLWRYQTFYTRLEMYQPILENRVLRVYKRFTPGYAKSNLSADHRISRSLSVTLNITNIANSFKSDLNTIYPTLGRQTLIGVSWRGMGRS